MDRVRAEELAALVDGELPPDRRAAVEAAVAGSPKHARRGTRQGLRGGAAARPGGLPAGVVYGYRGSPSWIFVGTYRSYHSKTYAVELTTTAGRRMPLPSFRLDARTGSAGQAIPIDLGDVSSVRLVGAKRGDVLEAELPHTRVP